MFFFLGCLELGGSATKCISINDTYDRDKCYYGIATNTENPQICENVVGTSKYFPGKYGGVGTTSKENCYTTVSLEIGIREGDLTVCEKFKSAYCYRAIALENIDESLCSKFRTSFEETEIDKCYEDIAIKKNNISICDKIDWNNTKYTCYARIKKDPAFCEQINDYDIKNLCRSYFQ